MSNASPHCATAATQASIQIQPFSIAHYDNAYALWQQTPGVGLSSADSRDAIARFLQRNEGLSFVGRQQERLVGTILCGHDGRRGWIHHLTVAESVRQQGIGSRLVQAGLSALKTQGIEKCHLMAFVSNEQARLFWTRFGAQFRDDLHIYSLMT